jgi:VCBS repeat-containing protein
LGRNLILKRGERDADTVIVQSQDGTAAVVGGALVI